MESEETSAAEDEDLNEEYDPEDSIMTTDPEDEVPDFIDEIEVVEVTIVAPPAPPAPVYDNPDYDPTCPGLNKQHCKMTGLDNTHKRKEILHMRNNFLFKKQIGDHKAKCYLARYPDLQAAFGTDLEKAK